MAHIAFHADESSETYTDVFRAFQKICNEDPPIVIIDKDFTEISSLQQIFPTSTILLCWFHVIKWMKGVIRTAHREQLGSDLKESMEEKENIMKLFKKMIYAKTEGDYEIEKNTWYKVIHNVNIILGTGEKKHVKTLRQYFDDCWDPIRNMWSMYSRTSLPLGSENTNNRIERAFRSMKDELKMRLPGRISIYQAIPCLIDWAEGQLSERYITAQCQSVQILDSDPDISQIYKKAGQALTYHACLKLKTAVDRLKDRRKMMQLLENGEVEETWKVGNKIINKQYNTSLCQCNCTFFKQNRCLCSHILFVRQAEGICLFDPTLYPKEYLTKLIQKWLMIMKIHQVKRS